MTQHFAVPVGKIKLVIYDDREVSRSRGRIEAHILGRPDQYYLIRIPPLLWYGFQGVSPEPALLANCPDLPHDPQEVKGRPVSDPSIPYRWTVNNDPPG
jgi:dTDP-4-dehydrorhamnose 3,5-epimerase